MKGCCCKYCAKNNNKKTNNSQNWLSLKQEKNKGERKMQADDPIQANTGLAFLSFFPYASFLILFHTLRLKHAQHSIYENIQSQNPYDYFWISHYTEVRCT